MLALFDIENLLKNGGLALLGLIVFAESGMLVGFFFPGDSLLFIAGFLASDAGAHKLPALPWVIITVVAAAIIGDQVGYLIGRKLGPKLFNRENSRLLNPRNVDKTQTFFEHHGPKTIILARFVPVVRTFTPILAGVGKMHYRRFVTFNVIGGLLWSVGVIMLGYWFGNVAFIKNNIEIVLIGIVVLSIIPAAIEFLRHRKQSATEA